MVLIAHPFPLRCPKGRHHRNNGLHAFIIAGSAFSLSETHYTAHHIVQNFKIPRFDLQFPGKNPLKYFVSRCENPLIQQCAFSRRCLVDGKLCILKTDNRDKHAKKKNNFAEKKQVLNSSRLNYMELKGTRPDLTWVKLQTS